MLSAGLTPISIVHVDIFRGLLQVMYAATMMRLATLVVLCITGAIAQKTAPAPAPAQRKLDVEGQTLLITDNIGKLQPSKGYALFYR